MIRELLPEAGHFYKANLHCHSTMSDGKLTPEQLRDAYRAQGYSVLCITDHEYLLDHCNLNLPDFLMLTGDELYIKSSKDREEAFHCPMVHLNLIARETSNARNYQTRYLQGIAAAMRSESGKIGFVGAFKNAEVNVSLNAYALGAQSVNPDVTVYVKYTNSWYDPDGETAAANALIDLGCDVICQYVNTTGPQTAAQERGVWGLGSDYDMTEFAPDAHLFAACMNWGAIYTKLVSTIVNGEFHGGLIYGDVADGTLYLTPFSKNVADGTQEAVQAAMDKMVSGEWDVFQQDVYDVDGNLVPAATFTDDYLYSGMTDLLVKGVVAK